MTGLWKSTNYTLFNSKYKISINTTLQLSIKILSKCSCVSKNTKWIPSSLQFVTIWFSYCLKRDFFRKSRDPPLCFPEPLFGFPTFIRAHATTVALQITRLGLLYLSLLIFNKKFTTSEFAIRWLSALLETEHRHPWQNPAVLTTWSQTLCYFTYPTTIYA